MLVATSWRVKTPKALVAFARAPGWADETFGPNKSLRYYVPPRGRGRQGLESGRWWSAENRPADAVAVREDPPRELLSFRNRRKGNRDESQCNLFDVRFPRSWRRTARAACSRSATLLSCRSWSRACKSSRSDRGTLFGRWELEGYGAHAVVAAWRPASNEFLSRQRALWPL